MGRRPENSTARGNSGRGKRGFQSAAAKAHAAIDAVAGQHGFATAEVLLHWPEIVGAALADKCRPVTVRYSGYSFGATLVVQASSARAPEIDHLAHAILERVNRHYGYRAVTRLKITQSAAEPVTNGFGEPAAPFAAADLNPTDQDRARAAEMVQEIDSPGLRAALTTMGAHVLAQDRAGGPPGRTPPPQVEGSDNDR